MTAATSQDASIDALMRADAALGRWRVNPSFEPILEQTYEATSSERRNRALRFWLLFGLLLRVLGLSSEFAIGGDMPVYGVVFRLGIFAPVVLVSLWFLSPRYSLRTQGLAATAAPFLCVAGLACLGVVAPDHDAVRYVMLAGANIAAVNLLMPLRFRHAAVFTFASMAVYLSIALSGVGKFDLSAVIDIVFLFSMASIASLAVAYRNDVADRRTFLAGERITLQADALARANAELRRLLNTDALTGVYNRRYLDQVLETCGKTAIVDRTSLGVLMVDVDHFKPYNDMLGHQAGDECLRMVAQAVVATVRINQDVVTRYGGEEFAVLVPGLSDEGAEALGERVRAAIEALAISHPRTPNARVTVSVGVAAIVPDSASALERLIKEADGALYRSKHLGRNRVTRAGAPQSDDVKSAA
ncbi:GGDEF domain-containing protein [Hyphomicrobium sp.]|uniref:GGDEF domain-containing protein n=1 Tax=Hyphomicrobium sp. TaxID=82 RepID=UPI002E321EBD|nr:GGDEF domain-containing protein [Hyphomicrobium sp.]HEX2842654.1 GGDEF domain-containing protein [Hyphomicrobium sp.]